MCAQNVQILAVENEEPLTLDHVDQDHKTLLKIWEKWECSNAKANMLLFNNMSAFQVFAMIKNKLQNSYGMK